MHVVTVGSLVACSTYLRRGRMGERLLIGSAGHVEAPYPASRVRIEEEAAGSSESPNKGLVAAHVHHGCQKTSATVHEEGWETTS